MADEIDVLATDHPVRSWFSDMGFILGTAFRIDRTAFILTFAETLARIAHALVPVVMGMLISAIARKDRPTLILALVLGFAVLLCSSILSLVGLHTRIAMQENSNLYFDEQIARISGSCPTLEHLERPEFAAQVQILHDQRGTLGNAFNSFANCVHNLSAPIATLAIAVGADWRMAFLVLIALSFGFISKPAARWDAEAEKASAEPGKRSEHLGQLVLEPTAASEMRVLGARPAIVARIRQASISWRRPERTAVVKTSLLTLGFSLLYFAVFTSVMAWVTVDLVHGRVGLGHYVTALTIGISMRQRFSNISTIIATLLKVNRAAARYRWLDRYARSLAKTHDGSTPPPATLGSGIRLEHVSFRYPGSDKLALDDLTLDIPAGCILAVVGENGAGKSTLVKALTGMYDLADGAIYIDDIPLTDLDLTAWRARCSGAFQDHYAFEMTARESIGIGDLAHIDDAARIHQALEHAAATDVLQALPQGLDTQLGTQWADGVGLSGGQWQRLAIARGMMRENPLLLVLDEPTSALDATTEDKLFTGYTTTAKANRTHGGITLLVTHRFSTVAAADRVIVLDRGRIVQEGTHAELLAQPGTYADLYRLQARGYAKSPAEPAD